MIPKERIDSITKEYEELRVRIVDLSEMNDQRAYKKLSKRFNELQAIVTLFGEYEKNHTELTQAKNMVNTEKDPDMVALAKDEIINLENQAEEIFTKLKELLAPKDPNDDKNAIIEIRAGTGGEEAALFGAELYRMYTRFAELRGWKKQVLSISETGLGGLKEVSFTLEGDQVYGTMRFESGVHRVQRVPETEANGRVHTSAITVAVLPEADEVDIQVNETDLKVDVYRSSGAGGQHVNTTDSAVRITHIPTGVVVTCQEDRSQLKNKAKALSLLRSKLLDFEIAKQEANIAQARKSQVGTGDRSAKIRTYNYPQSRVTDHRINLTTYNLSGTLDGNLDEFIDALKLAYQQERIEN